MKTKKYLLVKVAGNLNPLITQRFKLSEAHFISNVAQDYPNETLIIKLVECSPSDYKSIFG
jgi:hypothetical protein